MTHLIVIAESHGFSVVVCVSFKADSKFPEPQNVECCFS